MRTFRMGNAGALAVALVAAIALSAPAEARRGGSFGSRGARTYSSPASTGIAPRQTAPVQRSMTERGFGQQSAAPFGRSAPARSGGMMRRIVGGLIAGGLLGALLGHGFGSFGSGMMMALLQIVLIGGVAWLLFRLFRRRQAQTPAYAGGMASPYATPPQPAFTPIAPQGFAASRPAVQDVDIAIDDADRQAFERLLIEVQDAFGREDYAALRERTTPEVMSYLAEEMSQNATSGRRNSVSGTTLIDAEVAEAWSEGATDYATIAMRYESIDVMTDRASGRVIEGDASRPTQATELWTFVRDARTPWRVSAIQEA